MCQVEKTIRNGLGLVFSPRKLVYLGPLGLKIRKFTFYVLIKENRREDLLLDSKNQLLKDFWSHERITPPPSGWFVVIRALLWLLALFLDLFLCTPSVLKWSIQKNRCIQKPVPHPCFCFLIRFSLTQRYISLVSFCVILLWNVNHIKPYKILVYS